MLNLRPTADLAVDLGTSKIAVYVRGEGLVLEEPACIALQETRSGIERVVATGHEAARMCGRAPQGMRVIKPIQDGVVSDSRVAAWLLRSLLAKHRVGGRLSRRRFLVGSLYGSNTMELRAFEQVVLATGASAVRLVPEPFAAAVGAGLPIAEPRASMVVDVGGGATEAIVVSLKNVVSGGSVRIGGDTMNVAIIDALRRRLGLEIGLQEARRLKELVSSQLDDAALVDTRGFDKRLRRPRLAQVSVAVLRAALAAPLAEITGMVRRVIDALPAELAADLIESGMTLTGGGSATVALRQGLEDATQVQVKVTEAPTRAVINGCGRMLDYFDCFA